MSKKHFVLVPLFACSLQLVMGALNYQPPATPTSAAPPQPAATAFVAQPLDLAGGLEKLGAAQLLERASAAVAPSQAPWLVTKTWQKQSFEDASFEAEGRLVRGPNHCARLELHVRAGGEPAEVIIVSDGVVLAHVRKVAGEKDEVTTQQLSGQGAPPLTPPQIDFLLTAKGCAGPHGLLQQLRGMLENLRSETGTWQERPVIRLTGTAKAAQGEPAPRTCHIYLDVRTLWPVRVEWWRTSPMSPGPQPLLELEFREPILNRPLSHDECVREFSYCPE